MSRFGDKEIKAFFEEARRVDEAAAPPLKRILDRPRPVRRYSRPAIGAGLAAAALLAGVLVVRWTAFERPASEFALSAWRSPTAFLLQPVASDVAALEPRLDGEGYPSTVLKSFGGTAETVRTRPAR